MGNVTEDLVVYTALRDEIIRIEESQTTYMLNMYVVFTAAFAFGIEKRYLFFVAYIALIAFQSTINVQQWQITKISLYIRIFFEEHNRGIHWESINSDEAYIQVHRKNSNTIAGKFRTSGASVLAAITTISFCISTLTTHLTCPFSGLEIYFEAFFVLLSIVLGLLTHQMNQGYRKKDYQAELQATIRNYYESLTGSAT